MAIILPVNNFLSSFDRTMYWEITDNLSTDDVNKLRQKVPGQLIAAYVLRDTHSVWKNYTNTEVSYMSWEHASEHPVGDIYIVY